MQCLVRLDGRLHRNADYLVQLQRCGAAADQEMTGGRGNYQTITITTTAIIWHHLFLFNSARCVMQTQDHTNIRNELTYNREINK